MWTFLAGVICTFLFLFLCGIIHFVLRVNYFYKGGLTEEEKYALRLEQRIWEERQIRNALDK
jgi:hypothetical protein